MTLEAKVDAVDAVLAKDALKKFLMKFTTPAFGALPKREIELAVFDLLRDLEIVRADASLYELMTDLRITRSKASQLLFDRDVRKMGADEVRLNKAVQDALLQTRFAKDGDYFVVEIENPLVLAHLKEKLRGLGHLSDSSFNAALVRMSADAATDLIMDLIGEGRQREVKDALVAAGAPDTSVRGVLKSALKTLGSKFVGHVADDVVEAASGFLAPLFDGAVGRITDQWSQLFATDGIPARD